ncbi:hypothetical protein NKR19_g1690 [Coniochaeta hoffmannii]|uniref:Uncharacterized protein n=1 Tax=Coniochaeta hoffmannii TaxID=91930 RepID=A0AA38SC12_9PEZI|nr:hypothetical protein NKR19_g1690 [Coniochaeta hoffmannii]
MPAVTQQHQDPIPHAGKKRRRDENDGQLPPQPPPYEGFIWDPKSQVLPPTGAHLRSPTDQQQNHHNVHHTSRRHIPLPASKRLRESVPADDPSSRPSSRSHSPASHHLQSPPPPRELQETSPNPTPPTPPARQSSTNSAALLSRCHICNRKPARVSDLDSFADCERCGERACFVCLRECLDWRTEEQRRWSGYGGESFTMRDVDDVTGEEEDYEEEMSRLKRRDVGEYWGKPGDGRRDGHRTKICSSCCVERGPDGDVVCYGCLPYLEA